MQNTDDHWPGRVNSGIAAKDAVFFPHDCTAKKDAPRCPRVFTFCAGPNQTIKFKPDFFFDTTPVMSRYLDLTPRAAWRLGETGDEQMKQPPFTEIITSEEQFRAVMGHPGRLVVEKVIAHLDEHCRAFIARSPFVLLASSDAAGSLDVSPRGDPPGFVQVLDEQTLAIPDRPGNRRADTFRNLLQNDHLGMIFLVPGSGETLRVSGRAMIVRDLWLRERMIHEGKAPDFALVLTVEKAFFQCGKCIIRSKLWQPEHWPDIEGLPSLARALVAHAKLADSVEEIQTMIGTSYRERLY